jgi:YrbI family 3-deoxy-D-manno-octulosonate 8-phosphate phosphatase
MNESVIAVIPARGGSQRIPAKNLLPLAGLPLVAHSISHALHSRYVSGTYVSTDDDEIAIVARAYGAEVIERPGEISDDEATSEAALLHVLDERRSSGSEDPDLVVFLQCTSPVRGSDDIDRAIETIVSAGADSLFSATPNHWLIWGLRDGTPVSINYDSEHRQREQDMPEQWRENGSLYVFRPRVLREFGNRLGGKVVVHPMDYWSSFQLDTMEDARLLEWILTRQRPHALAWPERIDLVVFDFDGVMTDNAVLLDDAGTESVRVNRGDGWGIARLRDAGVPMLVLSTETHPVVAARCKKLELECLQGLDDKAQTLAELLGERGIRPEHVAYVGNDVNDSGCFDLVGFPVAVADANPRLVARAALVLSRRGGEGAVREFCDLVLERLGS